MTSPIFMSRRNLQLWSYLKNQTNRWMSGARTAARRQDPCLAAAWTLTERTGTKYLNTGITLPQDQPYKIKHRSRALQNKNRSSLAVPPFMSSKMPSALQFSLSRPFCSSIQRVQEEAKTKTVLAEIGVDLVQCVYCRFKERLLSLNILKPVLTCP